MPSTAGAPIQECFAEVGDPSVDRTKLHLLMDILVIVICARHVTHGVPSTWSALAGPMEENR